MRRYAILLAAAMAGCVGTGRRDVATPARGPESETAENRFAWVAEAFDTATTDERWHIVCQLSESGNRDAVPILVRALKDPEARVRCEAANGLRRTDLADPRAVPALIEALSDTDPSVRRYAAEALGGIGDPRAIEPLLGVMAGAAEEERLGAARALGMLGDRRALPVLLEEAERKGVYDLLGEPLVRLADSRAIPIAIRTLRSPDHGSRGAALRLLEAIGTPEAVAVLLDLVEDEAGGGTANAIGPLARLGCRDARCIGPVGRIVRDDTTPKDTWTAAVRFLGDLDERALVEALLVVAANPQSRYWMEAAARAAESGAPEVVRLLATALVRTPDLRYNWILSPCEISLVEKLIGLGLTADDILASLADPEASVRTKTCGVLYLVGSRAAVGPLIAVLREDEDLKTKAAAAEALGRLGAPEAFEPLIAALQCGRNARWLNVLEEQVDMTDLGPGTVEYLRATSAAKVDAWFASRLSQVPASPVLGDPDDLVRKKRRMAYAKLRGAVTRHEGLRAAAATALGQLGDPRAVLPLIVAMIDADENNAFPPWCCPPDACANYSQALAQIGPPAVDLLAATWTSGFSPNVRHACVDALGRIGDRRIVPQLLGALATSEDEQDQWWIADALGRIGDPRAIPALVDAYRKPNGVAAYAAVTALGRIKDRRVWNRLVEALDHPDRSMRFHVAEAMVRRDRRRGIDALVAWMRQSADQPNGADENGLQPLFYDQDSHAIEAVINCTRDPRCAGLAVALLGRVRGTRALPALRDALGGPHRRTAALVLARRVDDPPPQTLAVASTPECVAAIAELAEDADPEVRRTALQALSQIGGRKAAEALLAALADPEDFARSAARVGLRSLCIPESMWPKPADQGEAAAP